jgi:hypothetical protein
MKVGDIINVECAFCKEKHDFRVATIDHIWKKADCIIVRREDCKHEDPIYCQWVDIK